MHQIYLAEGRVRAIKTHQGWLVDPADVERLAAEREKGK
jgi:hypothetical protein